MPVKRPAVRRTNGEPSPAAVPRGPDLSRAVDVAYRWLRDAIMTGELGAGAMLLEQELALRIGVSRTPVREALQRLDKEGLVVVERYRKNYVAQFDVKDVIEIIEVRALLESHAAGRAASRITPAELARLTALQGQIDALVERKGAAAAREFDRLNREFHRVIWQAADAPRVTALLETSLALPFNALSRFRENMKRNLHRACAYHREIVAALTARQPDRAAIQMRAHILSITSTDV